MRESAANYTSVQEIERIHETQQNYFQTKETYSIAYRYKMLRALKKSVLEKENAICEALYADFKKPFFESELTEFLIVVMEINRTIKNLKKWTKPKSVSSGILNFPSSSKIIFEPYGNALIIGPWNYPFQLVMAPLIAAIAAGNTIVLKPSELTPHTSQLVAQIISELFNPKYIAVVQGDVEQSQKLLSLKWDYIFFTGSPKVGQIVYEAASKFLTPVTLELGGKNPCIVDETAPLKLTAKRIVWGKFVNAGQTCIAPDYLLVNHQIKSELITYLIEEIENAYGKDVFVSPDYPRIVNQSNFERLQRLILKNHIVYGGTCNLKDLYISPTLLDLSDLNSSTKIEQLPEVMQDEIFGPILPIIFYSDHEELDNWVQKFDKPLALYLFSKSKKMIDKISIDYAFGGGAINDVIVQFTNHHLPFGGVGKSGIGAYHGKKSFETFSHKKSIVHRGTWLDIPMRYAPYRGKLKWIKKLVDWL